MAKINSIDDVIKLDNEDLVKHIESKGLGDLYNYLLLCQIVYERGVMLIKELNESMQEGDVNVEEIKNIKGETFNYLQRVEDVATVVQSIIKERES